MKEQVVLNIYGKKIETQKGKWIKFSYTKDGQKFYDVKFLNDSPKLNGYIKVVAKTSDVSIKKNNGRLNEKGYTMNDVIFIKSIVSIEQDYDKMEEMNKRHNQEIEDLENVDIL